MSASTLPPWIPTGTEVEQWRGFVILHSTSMALLTMVLVLIWWTRVKRPTVVITMILSMQLNSASNLMGINTMHGPVPRPLALAGYVLSLCGTTVIGCTAFSTTAYVWAMLQRSFGRKVPLERHFDMILLVFPWVVYFLNMIYAFAWMSTHPDELYVALLGGYSDKSSTTISHFFVAAIVLAALGLDVWAAVLVVKNRQIARQTSIIGASENSQLNYPFIIRVLLFGLFNTGGLITAVLCYAWPLSHAPALYQACVGFGMFFSFGTQADLWLAARDKLFPSMAVCQVSSPVPPPVQGVPAFPSHIGRLSTFWISVTTYGGIRNALGNDPDLESLHVQVPDLLHNQSPRQGVASRTGAPSTLSLADGSTPSETPKIDVSWDEKDELHVSSTMSAPAESLSDASTSEDKPPVREKDGL